MKIFKTVGCFLYQYFEEAIAIFLLSIQFAQLTLGLYEESMQGFAFTFMFITAVFHQRDAQKSQKAYVELWYKISACTQAAKEKNKDLIIRSEGDNALKMSLSSRESGLLPEMRNGKLRYLRCNSCGKKQ